MSESRLVVTLDIGGSGAKAYAFDVEQRRSVGRSTVVYPTLRSGADPGSFEPDEWWNAALSALATLVQKLGVPDSSYRGITVSAIRIPFVLLDRHNELIGPSLLNKDRRALRDVDDVVATIGTSSLYELTGHFGAPEFGLAKILWFRRTYPEAWQTSATVLQLHDWFIYRLSGVKASEPSSAAMSQMLDVANGNWATELLEILDVPIDRFPEIHRAGTKVGGLAASVAAFTGLPSGLPVHVGGGDTHLSSISAGPWNPLVPIIVAGTTAPVHVALDHIPPVHERFPLLLSEHVLAGRWTLESNAGATGAIVSSTVDVVGLADSQLEETLRDRGFAIEATPDVPLTVISGNPFFGPEGWSRVAQPTIFGLRRGHTGSDVYTAALRGGSYAVRSVLSTLVSRLGFSPPFIRVTGGMSTSSRWCQELANTTGTDVKVRALDDVLGLAGAALVAGEDVLDDMASISEETYQPSLYASGARDEEFNIYLELYRLASHRSTEEDVEDHDRAR